MTWMLGFSGPESALAEAAVRADAAEASTPARQRRGLLPRLRRRFGGGASHHLSTMEAAMALALDHSDRPAASGGPEPRASRDLVAALTYVEKTGERPVAYTFEPPPGTPWRSGAFAQHRVAITDARPLANELSLDIQGFEVVRAPDAVDDFHDPAQLDAYLRAVERAVGIATGARRVVAFDHNLRSGANTGRDARGVREPVRRVHNDFTAGSGPQRARTELLARGENADAALAGRFALINLWRPLRGPVRDAPLALADARSIAPGDFVAQDLVYRDRVGETYGFAYSPAHRWYYLADQQRDEALLIKCYDSDAAQPARFTAHTAFDDPTVPPGAPPRESIEVRTLVLY